MRSLLRALLTGSEANSLASARVQSFCWPNFSFLAGSRASSFIDSTDFYTSWTQSSWEQGRIICHACALA